MMLTILIIYMALMFGVGIWANKYNSGMTDYLLAGRRLGVVLGSFTLVATYLGGGIVLGMSASIHSGGLVHLWFPIAGGVALILVGLMGYRLRNLAIYTVPDYLEKRYGGHKSMRVVSAFLSLVALIGILAAQISAAKSALSLVGLGSMTAAVIATLIFIIYTAVGGLWAATLTDFIQVIISVIGLLFAAIFAVNKAGGLSVMMDGVAAAVENKDAYLSLLGNGSGDINLIIGLVIPTIMYILIGQDVYQRVLATKDAKTARTACIVAGLVFIVVCFLPVLLSLSGRVLLPGLEDSSQVIPKILENVLPAWFAGLVLAAILAAVMSTADSILTAGSSHVINDIYLHLFKKDADKDEKSLLKLSRIWTVIIGILAIFVATAIPNVISLLLMSYTLYTAGVFVPVVGGFIWKGATYAGGMASLLVGVLAAGVGLAGVDFGGVPIEILAAIISLVVFIVVSLLTKKNNEVEKEEAQSVS